MTEKLQIDNGEITLTQALKLAGLAQTGGEAKVLIADGRVRVNGEVELRKRRQLAPGDVIELVDGGKVVLT